jgi:hypothetical protein
VIEELLEELMKAMPPQPPKRSNEIVIKDLEIKSLLNKARLLLLIQKIKNDGCKEEFCDVDFDRLQNIDA